MGTAFSSEYLKKNQKGLLQLLLRLIIKAAPLIRKWRGLLQKIEENKVYPSQFKCEINKNLENGANHFQQYGWAFIENIFSPPFHQELKKNWPKKFYLNPPGKMTKSYNTGFNWSVEQKIKPVHLNRFPTLSKLYHYLQSEEFAKRITDFVGRGTEFICYSFVINVTYPGSQVSPHKDGIFANPKTKNFLNMVFLINGRGGKNSGGLILAKDNELKEIIFEPQKLSNSCLIYDSKADFYHGFPPVKLGKFRWAVNAQFCEKTFINQ
jgi:hypothetical protein